MAGHPLVGTWIVDRNPADPTEMPTTNVLTADGGLIDPSVGAAGVWTATGEHTADFTLIAIFAEGGGSYFLVRGSLAVDAGGDTATATVSQTHVAPDGTVLDQLAEGTLHLPSPEGRTAGRRGATAGRVPGLDAVAAATPTP